MKTQLNAVSLKMQVDTTTHIQQLLPLFPASNNIIYSYTIHYTICHIDC